MLDPFPIAPPAALQRLVTPLADFLGFDTLPLHAHEVVFSVALYTFIGLWLSPVLSARLCPQTYPKLNKRTKINWDVHVVSLFQSCIINALALWVIFSDKERAEFGWEERIWGYTGASGLLQAMATGYFLWDLALTSLYVNIFGIGMLLHAVAAVTVFSLGFRPLVNFYGPIFILYELSSPFLNFHWFLDKLKLTGSTYQAINGAVLTSTFFFCRIVWGAWNSYWTFGDMIRAYNSGLIGSSSRVSTIGMSAADAEAMSFAGQRKMPLWLAGSYLAANIVLNILNYYWFSKMIQTIRSRFDPPWGTKGVSEPPPIPSHRSDDEPASNTKSPALLKPSSGTASRGAPGKDKVLQDAERLHQQGKGSVKAARMRAEQALDGEPEVQRGLYADGRTSVEVTGSSRKPSGRSRRKA